MILTHAYLMDYYKNLSDPKGRIRRDVKNNKLIPIVRGLYETNPNTTGATLCQFIYGPSYLSFDYALHHHGLIPEAVYKTYTCATYNKRKTKVYENYYGTYIYRDVPKAVYSLGVMLVMIDNYSLQLATAEKALCDKLYIVPPVRSIKELKEILFDDLRINREGLDKLNKEDILEIAPLYHSSNLDLLVKFIKGEMKNATNN